MGNHPSALSGSPMYNKILKIIVSGSQLTKIFSLIASFMYHSTY